METEVRASPNILIHDPTRRRWSEATTLISEDDLKRAETTDSVDGESRLNDVINDVNGNLKAVNGTVNVVKGLKPSMPDIRVHTVNRSQEHHHNDILRISNQNESPSSSCYTTSVTSCSQSPSIATQCQGHAPVSCQGHIPVTFRTPQKPQHQHQQQSEFVQKLNNFTSGISGLHKSYSENLLGETSDWMLAERSNSRSPPSPAIGQRSPDLKCRSPMVHMSPSVQGSSMTSTTSTMFNFSPETTELYRTEVESGSQRVKKRLFEEFNSGLEPVPKSPICYSPLPGLPSPSQRLRDSFLSSRLQLPSSDLNSPRDLTSREHTLSHHDVTSLRDRPVSPRERPISPRDRPISPRDHRQPEVTPFNLSSLTMRNKLSSVFAHTEQFRAKRRLDVDHDNVSSPKRVKIDLEREMGYRYLQQLETDITTLRHKLREQEEPETELKKPTNCTCAIMEKEFLEMAESAYRAVRRIDTSPRGFEQFRRELIQTNEAMKDSMDVLKNIRSFCEHKC